MAYLLTTLSLVLSILLSALIIPRILVVAYRKKLFDIPNERKVHDEIIPRLGGISFVPTILFSLSFVTGLRYLIGFEIAENRLHFIIPEFFFLICGLFRFLTYVIADVLRHVFNNIAHFCSSHFFFPFSGHHRGAVFIVGLVSRSFVPKHTKHLALFPKAFAGSLSETGCSQ